MRQTRPPRPGSSSRQRQRRVRWRGRGRSQMQTTGSRCGRRTFAAPAPPRGPSSPCRWAPAIGDTLARIVTGSSVGHVWTRAASLEPHRSAFLAALPGGVFPPSFTTIHKALSTFLYNRTQGSTMVPSLHASLLAAYQQLAVVAPAARKCPGDSRARIQHEVFVHELGMNICVASS